MRVLAPAKINLHLRVGRRRADGFHPLLSWMCTVGLFDTLDFTRARSGELTLHLESPNLPHDHRNMVVKAAAAMMRALADSPSAVGGVGVALAKGIPIGAGLGGGSSDGARTLLALNALWQAGWPPERLAELGAQLGSDVPFFFHAPSAICAGRGEIVRPIAPPRPRWAILILPDFAISTADVYRRFDELNLGSDEAISREPNWTDWARLPAQRLLPHLVNDLEPAAFSLRPDLDQLRQDIEQLLGRIVRMSGSGSSLFTLFDNRTEAENAAEEVSRARHVRALPVELAPGFSDDLNAGDD